MDSNKQDDFLSIKSLRSQRQEQIQEQRKEVDRLINKYFSSDDYANRLSQIMQQSFSFRENELSSVHYSGGDWREIIMLYRDLLLMNYDNDVICKSKEKVKVISSLDNSLYTMNNKEYVSHEFSRLEPENKNSFLIIPVRATWNREDCQFNHVFSTVIRKQGDGYFRVTTIDKAIRYLYGDRKELARESEIHPCTKNYFVNIRDMHSLAEVCSTALISRQNGDFEKDMREISKAASLGNIYMSPQKTGNCYVKELQAGINFAIGQENISTKYPNLKCMRPNHCTTLQLQGMLTAVALCRLEQNGYGKDVINKLKEDFYIYKNMKKEIDPKKYNEKKALLKDIKKENSGLKFNYKREVSSHLNKVVDSEEVNQKRGAYKKKYYELLTEEERKIPSTSSLDTRITEPKKRLNTSVGQPSTSRTGTFPMQQKFSLNERRQSAESIASLKNSNLSRSSSQASIQH